MKKELEYNYEQLYKACPKDVQEDLDLYIELQTKKAKKEVFDDREIELILCDCTFQTVGKILHKENCYYTIKRKEHLGK